MSELSTIFISQSPALVLKLSTSWVSQRVKGLMDGEVDEWIETSMMDMKETGR